MQAFWKLFSLIGRGSLPTNDGVFETRELRSELLDLHYIISIVSDSNLRSELRFSIDALLPLKEWRGCSEEIPMVAKSLEIDAGPSD